MDAAAHELLTVTREMRRLIQTGARVELMMHTAINDGMRTLRGDGAFKAMGGITSLEEIMLVTAEDKD